MSESKTKQRSGTYSRKGFEEGTDAFNEARSNAAAILLKGPKASAVDKMDLYSVWDKLYAFEGLRKLTKFHGLEEKEMSTKKEVIEALIKEGDWKAT